jgi:hypothetical protein
MPVCAGTPKTYSCPRLTGGRTEGLVAFPAAIDYIDRDGSPCGIYAMSSVISKVMSTVGAPYGVLVTPSQLAEKIADPKSVDDLDCSVFAFLSEVSPKLQLSFVKEMGVSGQDVALVATKFSDLAGYKLPFAA